MPRDHLLRPFRPRRARVVAVVGALLITGGYAALVATVRPHPNYGGWDRIGVAFFIAAGLYFLYRQFQVRARPDESGLVIRNLFRTHQVEWAQIISVRFGSGRPWARLDISDGSTIPVMAIQAADGLYGQVEAERLADLVEYYGIDDVPWPSRATR